ncbi:MAG: efflux RND transporter permease subunit [Candidatus Cloacimonadaceae bacterium]|nr:efflux RND transporter permease subunit [Candidatus Cloacimonadaceae bacterium]
MFLAKISIARPVLVTMAIMVFVVFGALAYMSLPLNLMPDVDIPFISIQTIYPGAGPAEIESQITNNLEDAVATVSQIDYVQSYSMENVSIVVIAFKLGKNVDIANQEVKDKIDAVINQLPADSQKPTVQKIEIGAFPFMDIVLSGNMDGKALYELADTKLKDRFAQIEGVAQVNMTGGNKRQINVKLKDSVIFENKLSLPQLMQILAAQNMDMPAGNFIRGSQEYSVRLKGEFSSIEEIADANIPTAFGVKKLSQLAQIEDGIEDVRSRAIYFNAAEKKLDENIIRLSLTKSADGNVVNIAKEVRKQLPLIEKEMPKGVQLRIIRDDSEFTRSTVSDTLGNIWMGILLTGLILFLFLHDLRSTLIVALSMPISIISTFVFIKMAGFTINILTLMGLSTAVGILVTNSVVVIENIFRHKNMGNSRREAADKGTAEIAVAVLASTLTNIVVFLPIATMTSMVGQFFREFALTVTFATIFSLISSFTITPMLASMIIPEGKYNSRFGLWFDAIFDKFGRLYQRFLGGVLSSKKRSIGIILITVAILLGSFALVPILGLELFPSMDQGSMSITVELPQGYNLEETSAVFKTILERTAKHKEVEHVITNIGTLSILESGSNLASAEIKLVDKKMRKRSTTDMMDLLTQELADIPNGRIKVGVAQGFGGGGSPIEFFLQGQDTQRLEQLKSVVFDRIKDSPGMINLDTSTRSRRAEITINPKRYRMADLGATVYELALALRASVEGFVSTQYREAGNQYDIKLSLEDDAVDAPDKLRNLSVVIRGESYLLSQLADIDFSAGTSKITHRDRFKSIQFSADIAKGANLGDVTTGVKKQLEELTLPPGYQIVWGGDAAMLNDTVIDMMRTFILAVLLTYMLLAAILESFSQPLLIMATVPLALIGVVASLLLAGMAINIFSMMAVIMLVGIVVNNAILILDYVNAKRREGMSTHDALLEAGQHKLKPIIMSTLSIVIGMMPMALGVGSSAREFRQSMGTVTIGGLIVSSFLTLVIIPAFYYLTTKQDANKVETK